MKYLAVVVLLPLLLPWTASGELVKSKGKGEVTYRFTLGVADERAAIAEAKKNALSRYAATFDAPRFELYKKIEPAVLADVDQYVSDYTELDHQNDTATKRYTVVIEASINATLIENAIQQNSAQATNGGAGQKGETSYITFVFVARELATRKFYDAKRTTVDRTESADKGAESSTVSENGQSAGHSLDKDSMVERTTGGNTELKAEELSYRVSTISEVDNAVNAVLTKAGYETVDAVDAGLDVDGFKKDFSEGNDIGSATRTAAIKTCKEKEIKFFAVANMDVGLPQKDEATGMMRVYVTVTAKVSDLSPKFPKTVASIAGKPYAGLGPDPQVAKQNALNEAATKSAADLVDQLRFKNVK